MEWTAPPDNQSERAPDAPAPAQGERVVLRYDLAAAAAAAELPDLSVAHERTCAALARRIERYARQAAVVDPFDVEHCPWQEVVDTAGVPVGVAAVDFPMLGARGVLLVEAGLLADLLDMMVGGSGGAEAAVDLMTQRGLTRAERHLFATLVRECTGALVEGVDAGVFDSSTIAELGLDPRGALGCGDDDSVVKLPMQVTVGSTSGLVQWVFLPAALRVVARCLERSAMGDMAAVNPWRAAIEAHLRQVETDFVVELGHCELTLGALARLRPGDIVRLDRGPDDDVVALCGDTPVAYGRVALVEGTVRFELSRLAATPASAPRALVARPAKKTPDEQEEVRDE